MDQFTKITDFPAEEINKLRWLLRQHGHEMVEAGVALKYGREWQINRSKLPDFLRDLTLRARKGAAS